MERFPTSYDNKPIQGRIPYAMRGELLVAVNTSGVQFPEATFQQNVDKPFEMHRMIPDITMFDTATPPVQISPVLHFNTGEWGSALFQGVRLTLLDTAKNEFLTKNPTLLAQLIDKDRRCWEWEDPYTIPKSTNLLVTVDNIIPAVFATGTVGAVASANCGSFRIELTFEGYLLVQPRVPA